MLTFSYVYHVCSFRRQIQIGSGFLINCHFLCDSREYRKLASGQPGLRESWKVICAFPRYQYGASYPIPGLGLSASLSDSIPPSATAAPSFSPWRTLSGLLSALWPMPLAHRACVMASTRALWSLSRLQGCISSCASQIKHHLLRRGWPPPPHILTSFFSILGTWCFHSTYYNP